MKLAIFLLIIYVHLILGQSNGNHKGFKVYKIHPKSDEELQYLVTLSREENYDFWGKIKGVGEPNVVMVPPKVAIQFEKELSLQKVDYEIIINDFEKILEQERINQSERPSLQDQQGRISFTQYYTHDEINTYLRQVSEANPNRVRLNFLGKSYQNRDLYFVRISSDFSSRNRPVIFVECGMHAREWISPAFALYLINQLAETPSNEQLIRDVDWIILPVMNPDGYDFTWTNNRMWRKTRSGAGTCIGTDGNRNFDFHWMVAGASNNPCSETYAGPRAFSEPEARLLRDILAATKNIRAFVSVHSYGQYFFYPYSYASVKPSNWQTLHSLAQNVTNAITAVNGTRYQIGSSTEVLYPAAGCTDDWAMGGANISVVFCIELPGGGNQGFNLPPERILPVAQETFEGFKVIQQFVINNNAQ